MVVDMDADIAPSRRERKKQATREALHQAAFELAEEVGLAGVTIEAVTERADVAPRTFFNYFASKEDAVLGHDPGRAEALCAALAERPAGEDALAALQGVLTDDVVSRVVDTELSLRWMRLVTAEPHLMAAMAATFDEIGRALVAAVAERTGQDPVRDLYPSLLVASACGACRVALMRWCDQGGDPPLTALVAGAFDQLAAGLSRPAAPRPAAPRPAAPRQARPLFEVPA